MLTNLGINGNAYAKKNTTADMQFARGSGFEALQVVKSRGFLCYGPNGELLATNYSSTGGRTLCKSTDGGATWTDTGEPDTANNPVHAWTLSDGSVLVGTNSNKLYRTTDLGATSTLVHTLKSGSGFLGQCVSEAPDGTVWMAPYGVPTDGDSQLLRSTDHGATWTEVAVIKTNNVNGGADAVRHVHGCLAVGTDVYVMTGDNGTQTGFWKYAGTTTLTRVTPASSDPEAQKFRAVGMKVRNGYFYWIQDGAGSTNAPYLLKAPVSDPGNYTILATMPTGGWYIQSLSDGTFICSGVIEGIGQEEDKLVRLWSIDLNDNVSEVYAAVRFPDPAVAGNYGSIKNLWVDANDNIAFLLTNSTLFATGQNNATIVGKLRKGGQPFMHRSPVSLGVKTTVGTVNGISTTSTTATAAESVTFESDGSPFLVLWSISVTDGTAAAIVNAGPGIGTAVAAGDQRRATIRTAFDETTLAGQAILTPTKAGPCTVNLNWWVSAGTGYSNGYRRNITVVPLVTTR